MADKPKIIQKITITTIEAGDGYTDFIMKVQKKTSILDVSKTLIGGLLSIVMSSFEGAEREEAFNDILLEMNQAFYSSKSELKSRIPKDYSQLIAKSDVTEQVN